MLRWILASYSCFIWLCNTQYACFLGFISQRFHKPSVKKNDFTSHDSNPMFFHPFPFRICAPKKARTTVFMPHVITKENRVSYGLSLLVYTFVFANMVITQLPAYPERDCSVGLDFLVIFGSEIIFISTLIKI